MGGSASYRLGKKIANARMNGASQDEIDELERKRQEAKEAEKAKRQQNNKITTPGGDFPTSLPNINGVSQKQIEFAEDRRDKYINIAKKFDDIYSSVRPIMMTDNVDFETALRKSMGIDKDAKLTIEQSKQINQMIAQTDIAMTFAKAGFTSSVQPPELQSIIEQAKITYEDKLIGRHKRLPPNIMQRIVYDYTIETLKSTIRNETSASKWIELGKI